jgi:hypothetical protein
MATPVSQIIRSHLKCEYLKESWASHLIVSRIIHTEAHNFLIQLSTCKHLIQKKSVVSILAL